MNVLATFENDPRKIMDMRMLTVIFNVWSWKMHKKFAKKYMCVAMIKPGTYVNQYVHPYICTKNWQLKLEPGSYTGPLCTYLMRQNLHNRTYLRSRQGTISLSLQWRHNGHNGISNRQPHDCLLNRLFGHRSKKTSKLHVTGLCVWNSPGTGEFPAQMASNAENVSTW